MGDVVDDLGGEEVGEVDQGWCPLNHIKDFGGKDVAIFRELTGEYLDVLDKRIGLGADPV